MKKSEDDQDELRPEYDLRTLRVRRLGPARKKFGAVTQDMHRTRRGKPMKYLVNLTFDPEYRGYVADVPALPGCMSQGRTVEQALENVKDAIRLYREVQGGSKTSAPGMILSAQVEV